METELGRVREIFRYPVKSLAGETLDRVAIGPQGLPGDRAWAVRDERRGGIRGAKKIPGLMRLAARYAKAPAERGSSPAEIRFEDGSTATTGDPDVAERLSKALGQPVTLWPLLPPEAVDHYRRGAPTHEDVETELRATFGRTPDEPLPDLSVLPPEIFQYESPPGTYFDAFPLLLLTDASLRTMGARHPGSRFDVRRFRPNLQVVTGEEEGFPEEAWCGRRLRVGEAVLRVAIRCPRCVMTTHGFEDLPRDPKVMRALVAETGGNLGVYAEVERPGHVAAGDPVVRLD